MGVRVGGLACGVRVGGLACEGKGGWPGLWG